MSDPYNITMNTIYGINICITVVITCSSSNTTYGLQAVHYIAALQPQLPMSQIVEDSFNYIYVVIVISTH